MDDNQDFDLIQNVRTKVRRGAGYLSPLTPPTPFLFLLTTPQPCPNYGLETQCLPSPQTIKKKKYIYKTAREIYVKFGSCQNYMSSANLVAEIHLKLWNERALSTREPCTCEYVTLLQ